MNILRGGSGIYVLLLFIGLTLALAMIDIVNALICDVGIIEHS